VVLSERPCSCGKQLHYTAHAIATRFHFSASLAAAQAGMKFAIAHNIPAFGLFIKRKYAVARLLSFDINSTIENNELEFYRQKRQDEPVEKVKNTIAVFLVTSISGNGKSLYISTKGIYLT
jgi:hypothetical protein